jgi:hypothetical protein
MNIKRLEFRTTSNTVLLSVCDGSIKYNMGVNFPASALFMLVLCYPQWKDENTFQRFFWIQWNHPVSKWSTLLDI